MEPSWPSDLGPQALKMLELVGLGLVAVSTESLSSPIKAANEAAAVLLGKAPHALVNAPFLQMVDEPDKMSFAVSPRPPKPETLKPNILTPERRTQHPKTLTPCTPDLGLLQKDVGEFCNLGVPWCSLLGCSARAWVRRTHATRRPWPGPRGGRRCR